MSFLGVCSPKSFLIYYFLQLLPSLCLLSAQIIIKTTWSVTAIGKTRRFLNLALILAIPFLSNIYPYLKDSTKLVYFRQLKGVQNWGDNPAIISQYLRERVTPQNYIYVADYEPIIYYLVSAKIPSKYAFPAFITQPKLSQVAGIEPIQELQSILQKEPVYIIKVKQKAVQPDQLGRFYTELDRYLKKAYVLEKEFSVTEYIFEGIDINVDVELYRLKNNTVI